MKYLENAQTYHLLPSRHLGKIVAILLYRGKDGEEEMSTQRCFIVSLSFVNPFVGFALLKNS